MRYCQVFSKSQLMTTIMFERMDVHFELEGLRWAFAGLALVLLYLAELQVI
ncbi:hypothetical protein EV294_102701 [Paenibacillus sp. BK033]|nr:hypothetical protein EV294_102701 [Paenibacillus sp. BK033]